MAILRISEIRKMSAEELDKKHAELHLELMKMRTMVKAGGKVDDPGRIREIRRTIARILTTKGEKS